MLHKKYLDTEEKECLNEIIFHLTQSNLDKKYRHSICYNELTKIEYFYIKIILNTVSMSDHYLN